MFWTRVASGVLLAPLFLALVYGGSPYFDVLMAATAGLMAWEFTRMDGAADKTRRILTSAAAVAAVAAMALGSFAGAFGVIVLATVAAVAADRTARPGLHMVQLAES